MSAPLSLKRPVIVVTEGTLVPLTKYPAFGVGINLYYSTNRRLTVDLELVDGVFKALEVHLLAKISQRKMKGGVGDEEAAAVDLLAVFLYEEANRADVEGNVPLIQRGA